MSFFVLFLFAFDFYWFCVVIRFFHPCHNSLNSKSLMI